MKKSPGAPSTVDGDEDMTGTNVGPFGERDGNKVVSKNGIKHPFGNGLYHLFTVIWGMVYYSFTRLTLLKSPALVEILLTPDRKVVKYGTGGLVAFVDFLVTKSMVCLVESPFCWLSMMNPPRISTCCLESPVSVDELMSDDGLLSSPDY